MKTDWEQTTLGNKFDIYQPQTLAKNDLDNGQYPVYGANGIIGYHSKYNHEEPQVLVTCRGATCGTVNLSKAYAWINGNAMVFKPKEKDIDLHFLKHFLIAGIDLSVAITGAAQPQITRQSLTQIKINLPPISEQKRIAAILDKADEIRRKREQAIAKLEQLAQSIFVEMFGDPVTNNKNFERKKLGEIIKFEGGSQPQASYFSSLSSTENIRLVQIRDFKTEKFKTYIPIALAKRFFELDDVMIGRYGPPVFQILRGLSGAYNVALMKAVPRDNVLKDFIFYLLQEKKLHNYVVANSERTAGQSGVNLELLEKYEAYLPPLALQEEFAKRIKQIEKLKADNTMALANHNALFASLQQQAFSGNL